MVVRGGGVEAAGRVLEGKLAGEGSEVAFGEPNCFGGSEGSGVMYGRLGGGVRSRWCTQSWTRGTWQVSIMAWMLVIVERL